MVQSFGSQLRRWASLPKASIIQDAMLWIDMNADTVGQPCASASKISAASNRVSAGAADIVADIDAAHAERRRLAHHLDREMLLLVPAHRVRRDLLRGELPRHVANRDLVLVRA